MTLYILQIGMLFNCTAVSPLEGSEFPVVSKQDQSVLSTSLPVEQRTFT